MDTFQDALEQVRNEQVTDTPPDPAPVGNEGTPAVAPPADDYPASIKEYLEKNPDHREIADVLNRQFKADFTPRLQEAAELRKQYEGLDPNVTAAVRHLQQLIQSDPRNAAEYLRQQALLLEGSQSQQQQQPFPETPEFATDVEERLWHQYQALEQWKQEQDARFQQIQQQQRAVSVQQEFSKLEQDLGVQVPVHDRAKAWELSELTQGRLTVADAYFALNRSTLLPSLTQKARDEASTVIQQKAGLTVPGGLATREGPAPASGPKDFDSIWAEMNGR